MSFESWPNLKEISSSIEALESSAAASMFPELDGDDIYKIGASGLWSRLDVAAAIVDQKGRYLMTKHCEADEASEATWGPPAKTMLYGRDDDQWWFEKPIEALRRIIKEDLGVDDPNTLGLTARQTGSWVVGEWPAATRKTFVICSVLHIETQDSKKIKNLARRTADFLSPRKIHRSVTLPGTFEILNNIEFNGLLTREQQAPVYFPDKVKKGREIIFT